MRIENDTAGINPTAEFINNRHTGQFYQVLPNTYMIKGAINDRGFDQAYALSNFNNKEFILIDTVQEATREAVKTMVKDGDEIKAILITGKTALNEAYADLATISEEAGGAAIYLHPDLAGDTKFETKPLTSGDALLSKFQIQTEALPAGKSGNVLVYAANNDGMLFPGDSAMGSDYDTDNFLFSRKEQEKEKDEFEVSAFWQNYDKNFRYFFPRKGKPAIDVDERTRTTLLDRLSRKTS